ncbi:MAG: hypothetical protein F6K18_26025 [Okeania sp. SIO2C2]|uniref:hypothetical protein n=1 Tax=Okeania sp. SIO2C2 TaxID=2607787 RepID=UPI0013B97E08|nr:hypothetical protein [Okeania sp. SIO2C2]NEP90001.1 hypothetical protein [Okeania sp. SIO2C2]
MASLTKKLKAKLKKQKSTPKTTNSSPQSTSRAKNTAPDQTAANPKNLSPSDPTKAVENTNADIDAAKSMPPKDASKLLRAAHFLKKVLLELDGQNKDSNSESGKAQKDTSTNTADLKKATDDYNKAKAQVKDRSSTTGVGGAATRAASKAGNLAKKKPAEMTPGEIRDGIKEVENAIEEGKALLPADASLLQRALFALKMALFELGGVDPKLAVKDKEELEKLIAEKTKDAPPDAAAQQKVAQAVEGVNQAQDQIQRNREARGESSTDTSHPALNKLKQKKPEDMSASEIQEGIDAVEKAIEDGKALLPADAGLLQRLLFALKMALFELGGVDPELAVKDKDELEKAIAEKTSDAPPDPQTSQNLTKAIDDVNQAQAQIANRNPAKQNSADSEYPGLDRLKQKQPEELSAEELKEAIDDIERSIEKAKVLLPENASTFQRALYTLLMALYELGGVDPKLRYEGQERLEEILKEKLAADNQEVDTETRANFNQAIQDYKEAESTVQGNLDAAPDDQDLNQVLTKPEKLSPEQIRNSIAALDRNIKQARRLPPEDASVFLRAAYILREALLLLAGESNEVELPQEEEPIAVNADVKEAVDGYRELIV